MTQKEKAEQTRLYDGSVANAKELEALQHDVANLQKRRSGREDELLVLMEQREQLEGGATQAEARSSELRTVVDQVVSASEQESASVAADLASATAEREGIAAQIDPDDPGAVRGPAHP